MKAVCFDLDGTICDLWEGEGNARTKLIDILSERTGREWDKVSKLYDKKWVNIKREYMSWVAKGLDEVDLREKHMNDVFEILGLEDGARDLAEFHCKTTMDGIIIYPDAIRVLESMGEKHRLCMITNGPPDWQREKIEKLDITKYFEEIIVSGDLGHHKPDSRIFNEMTQRMGVEPSEIIYIGNDYRKDIVGAHGVGWSTAWVNRQKEVFDEVEPTYTIKELSELHL
jgi:2-haloalkanoic acid dehalogenase type II